MKKVTRFGAAAAVAVALAVAGATSASPARAAQPVVVSLFGCQINGGSTTVAAGAPVSLRLPGFAQGTYGLIVDFLLKEQTTLTIDRNGTTSVVDLTHAWPAPQQLDTLFWVTRPPNYDLGTLAAGDSVLVTWSITFTQPLLVAFPPVGSSGDNGPFLIHAEGPISCLITAGS
jgi:hypothetical protein